MASGFIILKDGRCWARYWSVYDAIIRIAIKELRLVENGEILANWLTSIIPKSDDEWGESGWGFFNEETDDWITRNFDTRSLTPKNQKLFWNAIINGSKKLKEKGLEYSDLYPEVLDRLVKMYILSQEGANPLDMSDWNVIADECTEKNGPDWD